MAIDLNRQWKRDLAELRFVSTPKRLRASLDGRTVVDTRDAMVVWEPRRVVPMYAVPQADLDLELTEHDPAPIPAGLGPVLPPHHLEWHLTPGRSFHHDGVGEVAFRPDDPALGGRLILHWDPFTWMEEDEPVYGHPHDPYARIDVLDSDRHVRIEVDGETVAESRRAKALIETHLPVRWYLPREDVRMDLLTPSDSHTVCAYKGTASYLSADGAPDVAWYYPEPLHDAVPVHDMVSFWRAATVYVDDVPVETRMPGDT
jgi:uncharacterized protein (DUF427 family)